MQLFQTFINWINLLVLSSPAIMDSSSNLPVPRKHIYPTFMRFLAQTKSYFSHSGDSCRIDLPRVWRKSPFGIDNNKFHQLSIWRHWRGSIPSIQATIDKALQSSESSLSLSRPTALPSLLSLKTTSSWTRLKHMAISAIPVSKYREQMTSFSWVPSSETTESPGTRSPNPMVLRVTKQK